MLQAGDIIQCDYCGNWLEIEEDDLQLAFGTHGDAIYIECPHCHNMIMQGIIDL